MLGTGLGGDFSKYNFLRFIFSKESGFREALGKRWVEDAKSNIRYFRGESLRYRATVHWAKIFKELQELDDFQWLWSSVSSEKENFINIHPYSFLHPEMGFLSYRAVISYMPTSSGNLATVIYVPTDTPTKESFEKMAKLVGNDIHRIAKWPKDKE